MKVLIVDDEVENLKALERTLKRNFEVVTCSNPIEALNLFKKENFAAVISDQKMPQMMGTDFLAEVARLSPQTSRMILTGYTEVAALLDAINRAEIYRYISKPWNNEDLITAVTQAVERHRLLMENKNLILQLTQLNQSLEKQVELRTSELKAANEKLSELAMTDPLTQVHNRRSFMAKFLEELERSKRYRHPITIAMIDVDHFKLFNDREGHPKGDEVLKKIAQTLSAKLRKTDFLGRYGGEEFIVLMPETKILVGAEICERLRTSVEKDLKLTVSIGISGFPEHGSVAAGLIESADKALYQAKQSGRNRVVTHS